MLPKPITYIINLTITTGRIPSDWKEGKAIPVYKQGIKNDVINNYRPILVLFLISKIMEELISYIDATSQFHRRKQYSNGSSISY